MNRGMILRTLKGMAIFEGAKDEELSHLMNNMVMRMYPGGRTVMQEGERGVCLYVLLKGSVKVMGRAMEGREIEIARLGPGNFFGEMAVLSGQPRNATIVTETKSVLVELSKEDLARIMRERPQLKELMRKYYEERLRSRNKALHEAGMDDRRKSVRLLETVRSSFRLNVSDRGKVVSRIVYGVTTDITEDGACVEVEGGWSGTAEPSLVGIRLPVELSIPGSNGGIKVLGEVKWCRFVDKTADPRLKVGIYFIQMSGLARDAIRRFVYGGTNTLELIL